MTDKTPSIPRDRPEAPKPGQVWNDRGELRTFNGEAWISVRDGSAEPPDSAALRALAAKEG